MGVVSRWLPPVPNAYAQLRFQSTFLSFWRGIIEFR
jgi:hypothetical protein